jgi:hypothetical protein
VETLQNQTAVSQRSPCPWKSQAISTFPPHGDDYSLFPNSKRQNSLAPSAHATTSNKETGKNPRQFPIVYKNASRAVLRRFPYSLFFVMDGDELLVIACFHASRDPSHWQRRT